MTKKFFIYKLLDENDKLLYVGQTAGIGSPNSRPKQHRSTHDWGKDIVDILVAEVTSKSAMDMYEVYLINKLKPKYNTTYNRKDEFPFELPELPFKDISKFEEKKAAKTLKRKYNTKKNRQTKSLDSVVECIEIPWPLPGGKTWVPPYDAQQFLPMIDKFCEKKIRWMKLSNRLGKIWEKLTNDVDALSYTEEKKFCCKIFGGPKLQSNPEGPLWGNSDPICELYGDNACEVAKEYAKKLPVLKKTAR